MNAIESQRIELQLALKRAHRWLTAGRELTHYLDADAGRLDYDLRVMEQLGTRAASTMINVAMLGGFSSGKSFLVGGLQGRLEYAPVTNDNGITSDQYIGLLYSASRVTTACPASVVPVERTTEIDASGRGYLRARFTDERAWYDIGHAPVPAVVAAYTTQDPRAVARGRAAEHRERTVAEVEVLLSDPLLPAKLYDLPGHGSPHPVHDEIANNAWAEADCFLYVAQATHTLSAADLELINRLHAHHLSSGKRVIWVLTAIDRADNVNFDNEPEWKDTLEANNAYLRENFPPASGAADTFIGPDGFIPVSPAWEALGNWHLAQGNAAMGERMVAASRMRRLRRTLSDLIDTGTGKRHIGTVAKEAVKLLAPRHQVISELLVAARLPLDTLSSERDDLSRRLRHLGAAVDTVRDQLAGALRSHIRRTEASFSGLADFLHQRLDPQIKEADLTKDKEANRIEVRKSQVLQDWVANHGPMREWETELGAFTDGALNTVRATLSDTDPLGDLGVTPARVNLDDLTVPPSQRPQNGAQDVAQTATGFVTLATPVAGGLAAATGIVTGPLLAIPAAVTLIAGLMYGGIRGRRRNKTALDLLRQEWIDDLDETARRYKQAFIGAARMQGDLIIERAIELLSEREDELSRKIILVESRLAEPANTDRSDLIARMGPHCQAVEELLADLKTFT